MKVAKQIYILQGASRAACYDLTRMRCWPIDERELQLLRQLARGHSPRAGADNLKSLVLMRRRGWIEPGRPVAKNLELPLATNRAPNSKVHHVWLELTKSCNLTCSHCYAESGPTVNRTNELSTSEWISVVEEVLSYGVNVLTFIGGEPTIRLDLAETLAKLVRETNPKIKLRMFSNFSIPSRMQALRSFVEAYDVEIGTAIYGINAKQHDEMTGVTGSFARTMNAIEMMRTGGVDVFVGMYVDLSAPAYKKECIEWLRSIGIKRYEVIAPSQVGRGVIKLWKMKKSKNSNKKIFSFTERNFNNAGVGHNCFLDHFAIKPNGDVSPCIMMRNYNYGNIKDTSINRILKTALYEKISSLSKDNIEGCSECEFRYACFDCRPDAMANQSNLKTKPACGYDPRLPLDAELNE
ncbi:radical SAM/SPASM domain-containing protein [Spartinivicinus poritis]|uniref:Radical SAM protein n=1 Tax=Spartinivicinus poritis TaxID=2994640 RepID=A0ABT5UC69_9GAMM|nr:radical SAM protein [Spartinivicinus sp. A2-2]MDE1463975.1 radical SAM protein [Spartinivicinus sp. A2-2]